MYFNQGPYHNQKLLSPIAFNWCIKCGLRSNLLFKFPDSLGKFTQKQFGFGCGENGAPNSESFGFLGLQVEINVPPLY